MKLTSDTDSVNVIWNDSLGLDDLVELGPSSVQDDRIEADTGEEAQTKRQLVDLLEHSSADLDNRKFSRLGRMRRRAEDAQIALDLALGPNRIQQPGDSVLVGAQHRVTLRRTDSPYPQRSCSGSGAAPAHTPCSSAPSPSHASPPHISPPGPSASSS